MADPILPGRYLTAILPSSAAVKRNLARTAIFRLLSAPDRKSCVAFSHEPLKMRAKATRVYKMDRRGQEHIVVTLGPPSSSERRHIKRRAKQDLPPQNLVKYFVKKSKKATKARRK